MGFTGAKNLRAGVSVLLRGVYESCSPLALLLFARRSHDDVYQVISDEGTPATERHTNIRAISSLSRFVDDFEDYLLQWFLSRDVNDVLILRLHPITEKLNFDASLVSGLKKWNDEFVIFMANYLLIIDA